MTCCDGVSGEGFSGGPVFNYRGRVLGTFKRPLIVADEADGGNGDNDINLKNMDLGDGRSIVH